MKHLSTDVLVVGAGGAGLYAAIEAARRGAKVLLLDRSLIGRGGATVMAQMTVAAAVGPEGTDHWRHHYADTIAAGRGLCDPALARLLCEAGVEVIREMDRWRVGWARQGDQLAAVQAPGHDRARCVYVDFLATGSAVSKTLRGVAQRTPGITRLGDALVTDLVTRDGAVTGAVALHVESGQPLIVSANATVIATGGLTSLYRRSSASTNMAGDGYALALRAGAELIDMEFVQFFPIGHLAPRLIGMDPIMWDPFRYKLGGRLLNGLGQEFVEHYGSTDSGHYVVTRDLATYAITKEVAAGRGSPNGGAWLSFRHVPATQLRAAFGPVIDRLSTNGIDLARDEVEVSPIAHYHMGGIRVNAYMATCVPGLFAAGEAVGGANGANRLSGNAITEALAFGRMAGRSAAEQPRGLVFDAYDAQAAAELVVAEGPFCNTAKLFARLQSVMSDHVGPFRSAAGLAAASDAVRALSAEAGTAPPGKPQQHDLARVEWFSLRHALLVAESVILAATARTESRGAHQREDFPHLDPDWTCNQMLRLTTCGLQLSRVPVPAAT
jgi:succinate dehydrogenase / fumarate reductase, flavoprotein subunit